jgi:hypothetical protein
MVSNKTFRNYSLKKRFRKAKGDNNTLKNNVNKQQKGGLSINYGQQVVNDKKATTGILIPKTSHRAQPTSEPNPPLYKVLQGGSTKENLSNEFLGGAPAAAEYSSTSKWYYTTTST